MSVENSAYGIPMPGDPGGVEDFVFITVTEGYMHVATTLEGDDLLDLMGQIMDGVEDGASFTMHKRPRPS